ncbi:hypothetical protein N8T08_002824 [Aspergillus melleus]|uniref:Uncharacterized protein n=1 Tax=Aspergillus melleus TaxID=138277 RepID=A0ACC3ALH3_9EURO|nr:hypothetical protein N8T08_002824 [Aspergillus melleus]
MNENMGPVSEIPQRCSLPGVRSLSSSTSAAAEMTEDRRLPPLPRVDPLPRGPFNPFDSSTALAHSPQGSQDSFVVKSSPWPAAEHIVTPPSPANSADSTWPDSQQPQKAFEWPQELTASDLMSLIAPKEISRKPPLQQLCGRKRKGSMISGESDDQREKHRIAEGNRRKNLSHLHRELDSRIHSWFLERAGWNPAKSLPESKEHIVQGAIYLIDFMLLVIIHLIRQENEMPRQLAEKLQPQLRCMQLQQLVSNLQEQNQLAQQQMKAMKQENQMLEERNQALEIQLKSYEHMFRSPKTEHSTPQPLAPLPDHKPRHMLPGLRVFCDEIGAPGTEAPRLEPFHTVTSQPYGHHSMISHTPPMTGPSSPVYVPTYSVPHSRRQSVIPSP